MNENDIPKTGEANRMAERVSEAVIEPVKYLENERRAALEDGMALCLSGGGYRAMLFHAGVLWRLNELGILPKLKRISSVSGGSTTFGVLAMNWQRLDFEGNDIAANFETEIVEPLRRMASVTIDVWSVLTGIFPFTSVGNRVAAFDKHLFKGRTLQDITDEPRFVFNATNVQSGALWRFTKPYMRDYRIGEITKPTVKLAVAVAASSAFPPVLSPVVLNFKPENYSPGSFGDLSGERFITRVVLTDGGVFDNLGLETAWKRYKTILVSDAGTTFATPECPNRDWLRHAVRVLFIIDNQVRNLRRRQLVESYRAKLRKGAYWSICADLTRDYSGCAAARLPIRENRFNRQNWH
jgi:NTE family protein